MTAQGAARLRIPRMLTRAIVGAGVAVVAMLSWAGPASAHTVFEGSDPSDNAVIAVAPHLVSLDFSQNIEPSLAKVELTDGAGHRLTIAAPTVDERRPTRLLVQLPNLPAEAYRLSFSIRDSLDLHETVSSVVFGVATVPNLQRARPVSRGPDPFEVALRGLARGGLAVLLGALAVMLLVLPRACTRVGVVCRLQRAMLGLALVGAGLAMAGDTALLGLQASQIGSLGPTFSRLVSQSEFGRRWLIGLQLTVGLALLVWWLRRQTAGGKPLGQVRGSKRRRRFSVAELATALVCLLAIAEAVAVGISGHAAAGVSPSAVGVALGAAHLLAVGAWIGGLIALAVVLNRSRRLPDALSASANGERATLLRRFSVVASAGFVAVVVTGLLLSGTQVATVTALLTTWYGGILLLKVAVLGGVALVGLHHARLVRSRAHDSAIDKGLRRTIPLEAAGGLIVVLLGAALGATAPARGPQFNGQRPQTSPSAITAPSGDLLIGISLKPNRPGQNLLAVDVFNTRRPAPAPIGQVMVKLQSRTSGSAAVVVTAAQTGSSHWDGGAVNLAPGDLAVEVSVARAGRLPSNASVPWRVNGTEVWRQPTVLSAAPLAPLATAAAVAVLLLAFGVSLVSRAYRRRRSVDPAPMSSLAARDLLAEPDPADPTGILTGLEEAVGLHPALSGAVKGHHGQ